MGQQETPEETNDVKNVLCLIFNPDDEGSTFLHNIGGHGVMIYWRVRSVKKTSHGDCSVFEV